MADSVNICIVLEGERVFFERRGPFRLGIGNLSLWQRLKGAVLLLLGRVVEISHGTERFELSIAAKAGDPASDNYLFAFPVERRPPHFPAPSPERQKKETGR